MFLAWRKLKECAIETEDWLVCKMNEFYPFPLLLAFIFELLVDALVNVGRARTLLPAVGVFVKPFFIFSL